MNAFLTANKEGFHLADVSAAPLVQRRRQKQRSGMLCIPLTSLNISTQ
jgi:hypothetical protein